MARMVNCVKLKKEAEGQVGRPDSRSHPGCSPDPRGLRIPPHVAVPAGMELGNAAFGVVHRMWADKAWVDGEVDERRAGP